MDDATKLGMNRTGAQMSPLGASAMEEAARDQLGIDDPSQQEEPQQIGAVRGAYAAEAERLGSVPVPGTLTGMVTTGMQKVMGREPEMLVDKLGERLAFERSSTRVYEAMIAKVQAVQGTDMAIPLADLIEIRDEEARHFKLIEQALTSIGADPTAQTPCADVIGLTSQGIIGTVTDPRTTVAQALNALLTAELTDNAGWELLIQLAEAHGQTSMANDFRDALAAEQDHLALVRGWLEGQVLRFEAASA